MNLINKKVVYSDLKDKKMAGIYSSHDFNFL
ncbi:hypothetical protein J2772_002739 [Chryseobacterium jejuense]|nr:hypothetical protein [Chryseobacterium jejuense]